MNDLKLALPEVVVAGRRLGRNLNHDARSAAYRMPATATPKDVGWDIHIAPMDQGNLGSCVPHAGTAMLATDPFWNTLDADLQRTLSDPQKAEAYALQTYRDVTRIDPYDGAWEPQDTGSDGLSLAKLLQQRGLNNGYQHVTDIPSAHAAIQAGPYPIGISWLTGMDQPGKDGVVKVTGSSRGGHEILLYRYDLTRDLWWCRNSWSDQFGLRGDFAFDTPGYQKLIGMQADGTPMTPITQPPPTPQPAGTSVTFTADQRTALDDWAAAPHLWRKATAAAKAWKGAVA
jgi:hypothetical protein